MRARSITQQTGVAIFSFLLIIGAILLAIGGAIAASRTGSGTTIDQAARVNASAVIDQGNLLRLGFDQMRLANGVPLDNITFDGIAGTPTTTTGLFNAANGTAANPQVVGDAVSVGSTIWEYAKPAATSSLGMILPISVSNTIGSYVVFLPHVKDSVCEEINQKLLGFNDSSIASSIPDSGITTSALNGDYVATGVGAGLTTALITTVPVVTAITDSSGTAVATTVLNNAYSVCLGTSTGSVHTLNENVYVNVIKP